jgi:hypothetical protein
MLAAMARKSQQFKYEQERVHSKKKPAAKPAPKKKVRTPESERVTSHKKPYALEAQSKVKPPSRKSSRKSPTHQKSGVGLKAKVTLAVTSPSARSRRK